MASPPHPPLCVHARPKHARGHAQLCLQTTPWSPLLTLPCVPTRALVRERKAEGQIGDSPGTRAHKILLTLFPLSMAYQGGQGDWAAIAPHTASYGGEYRYAREDTRTSTCSCCCSSRSVGSGRGSARSLEGGERATEQADAGAVPRSIDEVGDLDHQELAMQKQRISVVLHTAIAEQIVDELACGEGGQVHGASVPRRPRRSRLADSRSVRRNLHVSPLSKKSSLGYTQTPGRCAGSEP